MPELNGYIPAAGIDISISFDNECSECGSSLKTNVNFNVSKGFEITTDPCEDCLMERMSGVLQEHSELLQQITKLEEELDRVRDGGV